MLGNPTVRIVIFLVIVQLYSPVLQLWSIKNFYYDNGFFKQMISKKFLEKNAEKIKNKIIKEDIRLILSALNSQGEEKLTKLKNISEEELSDELIKNPTMYYFFKGFLYFVGGEFNSNFQQNFTLSYTNFKKAEETTSSLNLLEYADVQLNRMLMYGIGIDADPVQGFQNLLQFKTNNADLRQYNQFLIGYSYLFGKGTEQNFNKAYKYFNDAGKYAYRMLAFMYSSGIGVDQDINRALELMKKTEDKNFNMAMIHISNSDYTKGKYYMKKCSTTSKKCQKTYYSIFKYDYYDKVLNVMSYISF